MKIYFASVEMTDCAAILDQLGIENGFVSFLSFWNSKTSKIGTVRKNCRSVIVDSGAHSFFAASSTVKSAAARSSNAANLDPGLFAARYERWLTKHWDLFDFFVELDIGELVGQTTIETWRARLIKEGLGSKMIPVHHPAVCDEDNWRRVVDTAPSRYVGIEGIRPGVRSINYLPLIRYAYEQDVRVHGFAMTKVTAAERFPFYSVDSSSWKAGVRYGRGLIPWGARNWRYVRFADMELGEALHLSSIGINSQDAASLDSQVHTLPRHLAAVRAYQRMEKNMTLLWRSRGIQWKEH